ncbi:MAG: hypothetical protein IPP79_14870 [Chitinophagaceae bacterium]|nr:hypothetical protein [Chitinophagaceae bacterium]
MLKKILKWTGILIGTLAILLLIFYTIAYFNIESRANRSLFSKETKTHNTIRFGILNWENILPH